MASFSVSTKFNATDNFSNTLRRFGRGASTAATKATSAFKTTDRQIKRLNKSINGTAKGLGSVTALAGGLSMATFAQTAADATLELDKNISAAAAKFGEFDRGSKTFKALEDRARKLGGTTEFTAGQAAEGLKNLATAGFTAEGAMASLDTTLALATATQSELGLAADVAGKSLSAFGLKSDDPKVLGKNLARVSDVLNKIISTTGFGSLEELQTTMGQSGASAKASGLEIEQWGAIVGTAVSGAIDASSAGSQLNMSLIRLAKPTKEAKSLMKSLGLTVKDSKGNFRDIFDIMRDVEKGTKKMGSATRTAALSTLFGAEASRLHNVLLDKGIDNVEKLSKTYVKAGGTTAKMAELMRSGISGMVASVGSAVQELGISFAKTFDKEIKQGVQSMTAAARAAGEWVKRNKTLLKVLFSAAMLIGKIVLAVKAYVLISKVAAAATTAYSFAVGVMAAVQGKSAFAVWGNAAALKGYVVASKIARVATMAFNVVAALNPFVWIAAVIVAVVLLIVYWDEVKAKLESFSNSGSFQLLKLVNPIVMLIDAVRHFQNSWDGIKKAFKSGGILEGLKAIGKALLSFVLHPIEVIISKLANLTGSSALKSLANGLKGVVSGFDADLGIKSEPAGGAPEKGKAEALSTKVVTETNKTEREEKLQKSVVDINIKNSNLADVSAAGRMPGNLTQIPQTAGGF